MTGVAAEVKLGEVPMQLSLAHMVVDAHLPSFKLLVKPRVGTEGVSHDSRAVVDVPADHVPDRGH